MNLEIKRLLLKKQKVEVAKLEMELRVAELQEKIDQTKQNIQSQDDYVLKIENEIKQLQGV